VLRLDDQVDVIALNADVDDAKRVTGVVVELAARDGDGRLAQRLVHVPLAQAADRVDDAQHDVHRIPRVECRALLVRRARTLALGLAPRFARELAILPNTHVHQGAVGESARPRARLAMRHNLAVDNTGATALVKERLLEMTFETPRHELCVW
jgi:hypothetical protein